MNLCVYDVVWKWNLSQMEGRIITQGGEIRKILWTIYYQNCCEWKQAGERGGDITQVTQPRVQYVRSPNERQGECVFRISYFVSVWIILF